MARSRARTFAVKAFHATQGLFNGMGFELQRLSPGSNPVLQVARGLAAHRVGTVHDVGANAGQYASGLRRFGYRGDIISYEPLSAAHASLSQAAGADARWHVHPRAAVGATPGEITINVSENLVSSSVLDMDATHVAAAPRSAYVGRETVPLITLDGRKVHPEPAEKSAGREFLKIDTQGFEWAVLDGAPQLLERCVGVQCELSLVPLYDGQHLWQEVLGRLQDLGFRVWALQPGFTDPGTGATLQVDLVCFRD